MGVKVAWLNNSTAVQQCRLVVARGSALPQQARGRGGAAEISIPVWTWQLQCADSGSAPCLLLWGTATYAIHKKHAGCHVPYAPQVSVHVTRDPSGCLDFVHKNFAFRTMTLDELVRRVAGVPGSGAGGGWPELVPRGAEFGEGEEVLYLRSIGENPRKVRARSFGHNGTRVCARPHQLGFDGCLRQSVCRSRSFITLSVSRPR